MTVSEERTPSKSAGSVSDSVSSYTFNGTCISRAMSESPATLEVEDLQVNPRAHQVCFNLVQFTKLLGFEFILKT